MAAIELGIPYTIWTPDGSDYAIFNSPTSLNFCGYVDEITGLDDAGVRENAQVVVAGDGGYHGPFWEDRRPWTMSGTIMPQFPLLARDQAQETIQRVVGAALRDDGMLTWAAADGILKMIKFRKQQPTRNPVGQSKVQRLFQIAGVSADYRIYAFTRQSTGLLNGPFSPPYYFLPVGAGNTLAPFRIQVGGPMNGFVLTDLNNGAALTFGYNIPIGDTVTVDLTTKYPSVFDSFGSNLYGYMDPLHTNWSIGIRPYDPGASNWEFKEYGTSTSTISTQFQIDWNDAWL